DDEKVQGANDLCERYLPLAGKIARSYQGLGTSNDDLLSAAEAGLTFGSKRFDLNRGAFGPYVSFLIAGEITKLFKPTTDALSREKLSLDAPLKSDDDDGAGSLHEVIPDDHPSGVNLDLTALNEREKHVLIGRAAGESLGDLGKELGVS